MRRLSCCQIRCFTYDKKVKIIQEPNIEVDGIGLNYNKKLGIIKIMKDVKVQYVK